MLAGVFSIALTVFTVQALEGSEADYASFGGVWGLAGGGAALGGGLALVILGVTPRAHVEPWLAPAVFLSPDGRGLAIRF